MEQQTVTIPVIDDSLRKQSELRNQLLDILSNKREAMDKFESRERRARKLLQDNCTHHTILLVRTPQGRWRPALVSKVCTYCGLEEKLSASGVYRVLIGDPIGKIAGDYLERIKKANDGLIPLTGHSVPAFLINTINAG